MYLKYWGRTLGAVATIGAAWVMTGCGYAITSSDGRVFERSDRTPAALSSALAESGSHDLACPGDQLAISRLDAQREYAVSGCGARALYRVVTPSVTHGRIELVSRSAVRVPAQPVVGAVEDARNASAPPM